MSSMNFCKFTKVFSDCWKIDLWFIKNMFDSTLRVYAAYDNIDFVRFFTLYELRSHFPISDRSTHRMGASKICDRITTRVKQIKDDSIGRETANVWRNRIAYIIHSKAVMQCRFWDIVIRVHYSELFVYAANGWYGLKSHKSNFLLCIDNTRVVVVVVGTILMTF